MRPALARWTHSYLERALDSRLARQFASSARSPSHAARPQHHQPSTSRPPLLLARAPIAAAATTAIPVHRPRMMLTPLGRRAGVAPPTTTTMATTMPARPVAALAARRAAVPVPAAAAASALARRPLSTTAPPRRPLAPRAAAAVEQQAPAPAPSTPEATGPLPKSFEPAEGEPRLYATWQRAGHFAPRDDAAAPPGAKPFVMSMPPPNVTGRLHMGHAMFATLQDAMAREARMRGRPTLWLPGTDHAGIATQTVVEKSLAAENRPSRFEMGRDAFVERVWAWKREYGGHITRQLRRLGASCDWSRERFTLDEGLSAAVAEAFVRLHERGLVYRGAYMVNWSPKLGTAVSDLEVEYAEEPGHLFTFKYPLAAEDEQEKESGARLDPTGAFLPVATTRPETILGDTAVAVHPEDPRYKHLVGRLCVVPLTGGRTCRIIADAYVDREFGTGALKVTPGHDPNDYSLGQKHDLEIRTVMTRTGCMASTAGESYQGLDRFECREKVWKDLEEGGLAVKKEPHTLRVPRSQRGGEIVEPMVSEQWFVRTEPLAKRALEAFDGPEQLPKVVPERFGKVYRGWLDGIRDWCVSRQLWWGHRIPVWYVFDTEEDALKADAECGRAGGSSENGKSGENGSDNGASSSLRPGAGSSGPTSDRFVVARSADEALCKARDLYGPSVALRQEEDVLDTWFSSGLWPFSTLGWPYTEIGEEAAAAAAAGNGGGASASGAQKSDLARFYPTQMLETGHDILFFWVARMVMMALELTGQVPFETVYLHGLVRDERGRKMSKSLGNVVDPLVVATECGADALRFALATGTAAGQDLNLSMERVTSARNFTNKLWNAGKFILVNLQNVSDEEWRELGEADFGAGCGAPLTAAAEAKAVLPLPARLADRWVVSAVHELADRVGAAMERHDLSDAGQQVYAFAWGEFADWYVEAAKARLYGGGGAAGGANADPAAAAAAAEAAAETRRVLVYVFRVLLRLAHPLMPFVTEELWGALPGGWRERGAAPRADANAAADADDATPEAACDASKMLIAAGWPAAGAPRDAQALAHFDALQDAVRAIRNARAEYGVDLGKKIPASLVVADPALRAALDDERAVWSLLARVESPAVCSPEEAAASSSGGSKSAAAVTAVVRDGVQAVLPMAGLFDADKERARLAKARAKAEKELQGVASRLANPKFLANARPEVVQEVQAQADEARERLRQIDEKAAKLEEMLA